MTRRASALAGIAAAAFTVGGAAGGFLVGKRTIAPVTAEALAGWEQIAEQTYYYRVTRRSETARGGVEVIGECIAVVATGAVALDCLEER